jgi:hypothetical protein
MLTACALFAWVPACGDSVVVPCMNGLDCDDGDPCNLDRCDPVLGCVHEAVLPEVACDDGDACTLDSCAPGTGCSHEPRGCDDGNECTMDSCDPAAGCVHDGTNFRGPCDDQNPCTIHDACQGDRAGTCRGQYFEDASCDDGNPCTVDSCHPELGCVHDGRGVSAACDDGDVCTANDRCRGDLAGSCRGDDQTATLCDDGNPCTADACHPLTGCEHSGLGVTGGCDDGEPCTLDDACLGDEAGTCQGGRPNPCDDQNPCTADACEPGIGCLHDGTGILGACDDRNACTVDDACRGDAAGACAGVFLPASHCDDGNVCTVDTCDRELGCVHDGSGITRACDDGDPCTLGDVCLGDAAGTCRGPTPNPCDDRNPCTADSCDPAAGCIHDGTGIADACNDDSMCTLNDVCLGDAAGTCQGTPISCDDDNACTEDSCHPLHGCRNDLRADLDCVPNIEVTYPPRGATIQGALGSPSVTVTGRVWSGAGPITDFRVNGQPVTLGPDGSFSQPVQAVPGGNTLVFEALDDFGTTRKRVQAFLWSDRYKRPVLGQPGSGMADPGMGIWLSQEILDDGDHSLPPDDLATIFELVLSTLDIGSFIDPTTPIAQEGGYDIYLTGLRFQSARANLTAIDGGMRIDARLNNIVGDLIFDCPCSGISCGCWWTGGDSTGGVSMSSVVITARVLLSVAPDHTLVVSVADPQTTINNLNIWSNDWWTNFLISIVEVFIRDSLVASLEAELNSQLTGQLAPMLQQALSALAFNETFGLPRLDGGGEIQVNLVTDFSFTDFHPGGGTIGLRAAGYAPRAVPYTNLGVPGRAGCGTGVQTLVVPGTHPFELSLADDALNSLFFAAWNGGLMEFDVPPELLGDIDFEAYGITDLSLHLSAMLAPTATDCWPDGRLRIFLGDLGLRVSFLFAGMPVDLNLWATATMGLEVAAQGGEIGISITQIDGIETQLEVAQDQLVGLIDLIGDNLEIMLVEALEGMLAGGALATIPLPEIDLSAALPTLPPGTVIALDPQDVSRQGGNTIIGGDLR